MKSPLKEQTTFLELFLKERVTLLFRGNPIPTPFDKNMPSSWEQALSPLSPADSITNIWRPINQQASGAINILISRITDFALVVYPDNSAVLGLLYIFKPSSPNTPLRGWLAGLPATNEQIKQSETRLDIQIPPAYKTFCQIHNGFLIDGWTSLGLRPLHSLHLLSELPIENPTNQGYNPSKLLAFCGDGSGNQQCYHLAEPLNTDFVTYDWDHETQAITKPHPFWHFLEAFLAKETKG
jgi:hypothetical protein